MKKGNREIAEPWLEKALRDIEVAKLIQQQKPSFHDVIAFHCNQAAEKSATALMWYYGSDCRYPHDFQHILIFLSKIIPITELEFKRAITIYYYDIETLYPKRYYSKPLTDEDIANAIEVADYFVAKAISIIRGS